MHTAMILNPFYVNDIEFTNSPFVAAAEQAIGSGGSDDDSDQDTETDEESGNEGSR